MWGMIVGCTENKQENEMQESEQKDDSGVMQYPGSRDTIKKPHYLRW